MNTDQSSKIPSLTTQVCPDNGLQLNAAAAFQLKIPNFLEFRGWVAVNFRGFSWVQVIKRLLHLV